MKMKKNQQPAVQNVVSLSAFRKIRMLQEEDLAYQARILSMEKLELLNELVRFQEKRTAIGKLTPEMMVQGRILFSALETSADTEALRVLTRSYRRHLEFEYQDYLRSNSRSS